MKNPLGIKSIFTDVDWTILNHGHNRHEYDFKSLDALKKAQKNGVKVFLTTARPYDSLEKTCIFNYFQPDGLILANGAVVYVGEELIYNDYMTPKVIKHIIDVCNKEGLCCQLVDEKDRWLSMHLTKDAIPYFKVYFETIPPIVELQDQKVSGLLVFCQKDRDEELLKKFKYPLDAFRFFDYAIDIREHPIYKKEGIRHVLEKLDIDPKDTLALGDDIQDISMFEYCGYSVAMENGVEDAKASAKFITKNIDHHGVKYALKHFHII